MNHQPHLEHNINCPYYKERSQLPQPPQIMETENSGPSASKESFEGENSSARKESTGCESTSESCDSSSGEISPKRKRVVIPNEEYLRENLKMLRSTLAETASATEMKDLHQEPQTELELNQLAMVNIVDWIEKKLSGQDPSTTALKDLLDRIRETMLVFQEAKEGGRRPKTVKIIEDLFKHVYEL